MKAIKRSYTLLFFAFFLLLGACSSLVQKSGEVLEGNAFAEKKNVVYSSSGKETKIELKEIRSKDLGDALEITNSAWPGLALRGMPGTGGNFYLTEAMFLSSHVNGWNEFTLDLLGGGIFQVEADGVLHVDRELKRVQISSGKIRLKDKRLTGAAALTPLRNRRERILVLTEWMKEWQNQTGNTIKFTGQKEFENYWKPRLFPELFRKRKQPPEYSILNARIQNAEWRRADGVRWNTGYSEHIFPKEHWELRNSGAMLRDWEEALPWIFMEYSWETIIDSFNEIKLKKVK